MPPFQSPSSCKKTGHWSGNLIAGLAVLAALYSVPAAAATCELNGSGYGKPCPVASKNNGLIESGFNSAKLNPQTAPSSTPLWVHNQCRYLDYNGKDSLFVPFNSANEWQSFLSNAPSYVKQTNCCLPRSLTVGDVPKPSQSCAAGWTLKSIVDAGDHDTVLATANGTAPDATFKVVAKGDAASDVVVDLPIARDDAGLSLPASGSVTYAGAFSCGASAAPTQFIPFHMTCSNAQWRNQTVAATPTPEQTDNTGTKTEDETTPRPGNCGTSEMLTYTRPCPEQGQTGKVVVQQVYDSCTQQVKYIEKSNTCSPATNPNPEGNPTPICESTDETNTTSCPSGQTGSITTRTQHICDGSNDGAGRDETTTVSNTCRPAPPSCTTSTLRTTQSCPSGQTGTIVTEQRHICDGSNNGAGRDETVTVSNTCRPAPQSCTSSVFRLTQSCPSGQTGTIVTEQRHVCDGSNNGAGRDETVTVSNTCTNPPPPPAGSCTESATRSTQSCPPTQTGSVLVEHRHICDGSNNGAGRDMNVYISNTCSAGCGTSEMLTFTRGCPAGQSGSQKVRQQYNSCTSEVEYVVLSNSCQ